jgi:hypothetical protein
MQSSKGETPDAIVQALWNAIFSGTRLKHVGPVEDKRVFILKSIIWSRQESKVIDTETGEVSRFPWTELEFVDPIEANLPGWPSAPKTL